MEGLRRKGHDVRVVSEYDRVMFGRGQVIRVRPPPRPGVYVLLRSADVVQVVHGEDGSRVYSAGSDMRGDGQAVGY